MQSWNSLTINYQILINFGMHILNGVRQRMSEVQLCQRGERAQTGTLKGPNRGGHWHVFPTLWNALDLDNRLLPFDTFQKRVKTHLHLKYFVN